MYHHLAALPLVLHCLIIAETSRVSQNIPCIDKSNCQQQLGQYSYCTSDSNCTCDDYYYLQTGSAATCVECPAIGESCLVSQCCGADYLVCHSGVCMCGYNDYCWSVNEEERARFQRVAQCILAVALLLTATILFILFWKACTRRSVVRRHLRNMSADSFLSLNSIQRLVLLQLQDRPPPYNPEFMQSGKNTNEITEPPPSYFEAVGVPETPQGEDNLFFILEEYQRDETNRRPSANRVLIPVPNRMTTGINNVDTIQNQPSGANTQVQSPEIPNNSSANLSVVPLQNSSRMANAVTVPLQSSSECPDTLLVVMTNAELHI